MDPGMKERMKKYDAITHYLKNNGGSQVTLTFTQFDELLFPVTDFPKQPGKAQIGGQMTIDIQKRVPTAG